MSGKKLLHFIASLAIFMEMLDSTIINTAIPSMANTLHVEPISLKIALISYLLMLAIFVPISGWVADKVGAKKVFITAFSIFTISSLGCGFAHNLTELIIMRSFQGIGGAFLVPIARLLVVRSVPRSEFIKAMSNVIMIGSLGLMLGPVLGGLITEYFSWPWIFFVNIPIGIIAIAIAIYKLDDIAPMPVEKFDLRGFILFGSGLAFFIFGLSAITEQGLSLHYSLGSICISAVLLSTYYLHSRYTEYPVINTALFKFSSFKTSVLGNLFTRMGFSSIPFLLPLFLQISFHYTPADSGFLLMPMAFGIMASKSFVASLLKRLGYRRYLIFTTILMGVLVSLFALISMNTPWLMVAALTFLYGLLTSQQYSGMNSLAYIELNHQEMSSATSFMGTLQQFSQSLGVAVAALLLHVAAFTFNTSVVNPIAFKLAFVILGVITLTSVLIFFGLKSE